MLSFKPKRIDLECRGLERVLGELEAQVIMCIWQHEHYSVRAICDCLNKVRAISFNALNTVINRMVEKGLLEKRKEGSCYIYLPTVTEDVFRAGINRDIFASLLSDDPLINKETFGEFVRNLPGDRRRELLEIITKP